jgi:antitoxin MazE
MKNRKAKDKKIIFRPAKKHKLLNERLAEYKGNYTPHEWGTGVSVGKEV